jgi:hypothetical protein
VSFAARRVIAVAAVLASALCAPAAHAQTAPVIESLTVPAGPVLTGTTHQVSVSAYDPQGLQLSYQWTASTGTLQQATSPTALWTAPALAATATLTVRVTNTSGLYSTRSATVSVILASWAGSLPTLESPQRIAVAPTGELYVVDGRRGELVLLTKRGDLLGSLALPERAVAVAASPAGLLVSTVEGNLLTVDPVTGAVLASLRVGAKGPIDLAYDAASGLLWMAERERNAVRAIRADGTTAFELRTTGTYALVAPTAVALDAANGLVWVAMQTNESGPALHAFRLADGVFVRSALGFGGGVGQVTRVGGIAVDPTGRVWTSDIFQSQLQVSSSTGGALGKVGAFSRDPGGLALPSDVGIMANGDAVVLTLDAGRLERFSRDAALPECPGDADCDGLSDEYETANGLDPHDAGDAMLDTDGDGLSNLHEHRLGTSPILADSDGDGVPDGLEVERGTDPLDPADRPLAFDAGNPPPSGPGLVRLEARLPADGCTVAWTQTSGRPVALRAADTLRASFVARKLGTYGFEVSGSCGGVVALPASVTATVENARPLVDGGRIRVVRPAEGVTLDARFSSDGNGDPLSYSWAQLAGAAETTAIGSEVSFAAGPPSVHVFRASASDAAAAATSAAVPVLVLDAESRTPTARAVSPVAGEAGVAVALDATASFVPGDAAAVYTWAQVEGPPAALSSASGPRVSFVPPEAGAYAFEVRVGADGFTSPPARVDAYVSERGALPVAAIAAPEPATAGEPLLLDGGASAPATTGASLAYAWRQVSGPAAGLTDADRPIATVVPFEPGAYVFELQVTEGLSPSVPARVRLEASPAALPLAVALAPSSAKVNEPVVLDGAGSSHPEGAPLSHRWTQVAGPWVALSDAAAARPTFSARWAGEYGFELEVDDGPTRSAPVAVTTVVSTCAGDTDCDGIPDDWETQNGMDATLAADATLDADSDGLVALAEFEAGTEPLAADTDGDGATDGAEVAAGSDPLDPRDPHPTLTVSGPPAGGPGLVRLEAVVGGTTACAVSWAQLSGEQVTLLGPATAAPSFVARLPGRYVLEAVAYCGGVASDAAAVTVEIENVPPRPDPGRMLVSRPHRTVELDGSATSDANGDAWALAWDQVLGPAASTTRTGDALAVRLQDPGVLRFALTATDGTASASEEVGIYAVPAGVVPTVLAASRLVTPVGAPVTLTAKGVVVADATAAYRWTQVSGAPVTLSGAARAAATFTPPSAGVYGFEVTVSDGRVVSPAARVEVHASASGKVATAAIEGPATAAVGEGILLDGGASRAAEGGRLSYRWRQVSGPAAGLRDADRAVASVVPFAAGAHVFELTVLESDAESLPVRHVLLASAPGAGVPVAVAGGPASAEARSRVTLSGTGSDDPEGDPLRYRWTQVSGPWVALDDAASRSPTFTPEVEGTYGFELEVDDGAVRSAPAAVTVEVAPRAKGRAP